MGCRDTENNNFYSVDRIWKIIFSKYDRQNVFGRSTLIFLTSSLYSSFTPIDAFEIHQGAFQKAVCVYFKSWANIFKFCILGTFQYFYIICGRDDCQYLISLFDSVAQWLAVHVHSCSACVVCALGFVCWFPTVSSWRTRAHRREKAPSDVCQLMRSFTSARSPGTWWQPEW